MPVTVPDVPTVATAVLLLNHDPPVDAIPKLVAAPTQTVIVPVTGIAPWPILRIRILELSAMKKLPFDALATELGKFSVADKALPPSPL
jgi:hypothetical protein